MRFDLERKTVRGLIVGVLAFSAAAAVGVAAVGCAAGGNPFPASEHRAGGSVLQASSEVGGSNVRASLSSLSGSAYGGDSVKAHASVGDIHTNLRLGRRIQVETNPLQELLANGGRSCPAGMADVDGRFCVDKYEASLVEILPNGEERAWSPYDAVAGHSVRAVSLAHAFPQAYINEKEASQACKLSGKRLCGAKEWRVACEGPKKAQYGYGDERETGRCNDNGKSAMVSVYGAPHDRMYWSMVKMNNPALNQVVGTLSKSGDHDGCTNGYGVYDMVGNLHEWVDDPKGTFQGGYYLDTHLNGDGCNYKTVAHEAWYHDYSTGFRCCADEEM